MSKLRLLSGAAIAAAAALSAAAPAAHAATVLDASLTAPTRVAAYHGTVVWSQLDPAGNGRYRLVKSVDGGAPSVVPVPSRSGGPFDIDLGTNRSGALYAVYTRNGDIYRLSLASGAETKLTSVSSPTAVERDPTIQRGEIAFIRREKGRDYVRIGNTTSGSHGTRALRSAAVVSSVELGISHIAYVVGVPSSEFGEQHVHVRNIRTGRDRDVYAARSGGANQASITRPSFADDLSGFYWARTNIGSASGNRVVKYTLRGGRLSYAAGSPRYATGAWAGADLGFAASTALVPAENQGCEDAGTNYCSVLLSGPLTFDKPVE